MQLLRDSAERLNLQRRAGWWRQGRSRRRRHVAAHHCGDRRARGAADKGATLMGKAGSAAHMRELFMLVCTSRSSSPLSITRPSKRSCASSRAASATSARRSCLTSLSVTEDWTDRGVEVRVVALAHPITSSIEGKRSPKAPLRPQRRYRERVSSSRARARRGVLPGDRRCVQGDRRGKLAGRGR